MINAQKFRTPKATHEAAMKVLATIQDQDRYQEFLMSLLSDVPTFYRVAVAQKFFEQMPEQNTPHFPDKATMFFRMGLILEELMETFEKGLGIKLNIGFVVPVDDDPEYPNTTDDLKEAIQLSDEAKWDLDEFADGLSDMNVVIAGTGVICAFPMDLIDWDNHCANMSKLGDDARPQINNVTPGFRGGTNWKAFVASQGGRDNGPDVEDESGYRPDLPTGKWIKGPNYVPANPSYIMGLTEE